MSGQNPKANGGGDKSLSKDFGQGKAGYYEARAAALDAEDGLNLGNVFEVLGKAGLSENLKNFVVGQDAENNPAGSISRLGGNNADKIAAEQKRKQETKNASDRLHMQLMLTQMREDINARIVVLENELQQTQKDINALDRAIKRMEDGTFDVENNIEDQEFLKEFLPTADMNDAQWHELSGGDQMEILLDARQNKIQKEKLLQIEYQNAQQDLLHLDVLEKEEDLQLDTLLSDVIETNNDRYSVTKGQFDNFLMEEATQKYEAQEDVEVDRSNLTVENLYEINARMIQEQLTLKQEIVSIDAQLENKDNSDYTNAVDDLSSHVMTFG